jgi:hypothetical protein
MPRPHITTIALTAALLLLACRTSSAPLSQEASAAAAAAPPTPPAPPTSFTPTTPEGEAAIAKSFCSYLRTVGNDPEALREQHSMRTSCINELVGLLNDGAIHVSRARWATCEAHLKKLEGPLEHAIWHAFECAGLFVPQLAVGKPCASALVCTGDLYCDDFGTHACAPRLARGATCVETLMGNPCARGLRCSGGPDGAPTQKTCVVLPKSGERCAGFCEAPSFCVGGVCGTRDGVRGETCAGDGRCGAGLFCELPSGTCLPRRAPGSRCDTSTECSSGACSVSMRTGASTCSR